MMFEFIIDILKILEIIYLWLKNFSLEIYDFMSHHCNVIGKIMISCIFLMFFPFILELIDVIFGIIVKIILLIKNLILYFIILSTPKPIKEIEVYFNNEYDDCLCTFVLNTQTKKLTLKDKKLIEKGNLKK